MELYQAVSNLKKTTDDFLSKVIKNEKKNKKIEESIKKLEDIVYGEKKGYWKLFQRFLALKNWFAEDGITLLHQSLSKKHLERIIFCAEKIREYHKRIADKKKHKVLEEVFGLTKSLVSESIRKAGLEYTPLGLVESSDFKTIDALREKLPSGVGLKEEFERGLEYQRRMFRYFYKAQDHPLSILDFQLRTLEKRFSFEDELFSANLLYFLKRKNYKITPYLERFKKIVSRSMK